MVVLEIKFELKLQGKPEDLFRRFPGPAMEGGFKLFVGPICFLVLKLVSLSRFNY